MPHAKDIVLILGSAPGVVACREWDRAGLPCILAINNAWAVRPDWDILIHPEDFPPERRPAALQAGQRIVTAEDYVPVQNAYGGFVYAGGTMAFTAGYWALGALRPKVIAWLGCDMVYPTASRTHFYGRGAADPLRPDPTLQSLEAKAARLRYFAARQGCACVNLSSARSRLVFPRATFDSLRGVCPPSLGEMETAAESACAREAALGYVEPSGRYWENPDRYDPEALASLDRLWLKTLAPPSEAPRHAATADQ